MRLCVLQFEFLVLSVLLVVQQFPVRVVVIFGLAIIWGLFRKFLGSIFQQPEQQEPESKQFCERIWLRQQPIRFGQQPKPKRDESKRIEPQQRKPKYQFRLFQREPVGFGKQSERQRIESERVQPKCIEPKQWEPEYHQFRFGKQQPVRFGKQRKPKPECIQSGKYQPKRFKPERPERERKSIGPKQPEWRKPERQFWGVEWQPVGLRKQPKPECIGSERIESEWIGHQQHRLQRQRRLGQRQPIHHVHEPERSQPKRRIG